MPMSGLLRGVQLMSGIRGKPPLLYRYSKYGTKVLLGAVKDKQRPKVKADLPGPTPEQRRRYRLAQQLAAAQNLQALPRPLKPPARRTAS